MPDPAEELNSPPAADATETEADVSPFVKLARQVCERLAVNKRVRRSLPGGGRLRMDCQLPFLCIYRQPTDREDAGTADLVTTQAAYLFASGEPEHQAGIAYLVRKISEEMQEHFGVFLALEIWTTPLTDPPADPLIPVDNPRPTFQIVSADASALPTMVEEFSRRLSAIPVGYATASTARILEPQPTPPGLPPLMEDCSAAHPGCFSVGLAVEPVFRDATDQLYPRVMRSFRHRLGRAIQRAANAFAGAEVDEQKRTKLSFGPSSLVRAAETADRQLRQVSESFDFLLQATPVNADEAWQAFRDSGFRDAPRFYYRPLPYDPVLLKRRLFAIEIERLEDATLAQLFWEKQNELDRQITALGDIETPNFLYSNLQLYGRPSPELLSLAEQLLEWSQRGNRLPPDDAPPEHLTAAAAECVGVEETAEAARQEIAHYRSLCPGFKARVEVNDQIASGIMVSRNRLLISRSVRLSPQRLQALLHHEIGVHILTYVNGRSQRIQQMYAGLAGYEALQEGLAVFVEYLTGGLTPGRVRMLSARVMAAQSMLQGDGFLATFALLHEEYHLTPRASFTTALRAHRGGGSTKDIIYLRGLRELIGHLSEGREIEPLFVGKIALSHLSAVQELRRRAILEPPAVLPRCLTDARVRTLLEECHGTTAAELLHQALG
ncbi:flavohemoglobin expression-modulating QEGLA motif protein [Lignipirellula cremea]|uniref:DUF1704 domain-containing protein n=1 Tax=Lignipirellula cremea TaxID=2528010 RepID=A0A518DP43_9BACT|nr:tyrosine/phenylalanine carboxypeptidase domain-containing protein [Lignipirellula cremea]QDU93617.1 hypothetical protein Pla8534_13970 [Lignipirellula cremea]